MTRPEIIHHYVVTYDGRDPDQTHSAMLFAQTWHDARTEYIDWAVEHDLPLDNVTFWYRLTATVSSTWTPVGQDTDTDQLMDTIWHDLQTRTPAEILGSHPTSRKDL